MSVYLRLTSTTRMPDYCNDKLGSGGATNFHLEGYSQGTLETSVGSRGEAQIGGLRDEAEAVCRHCLHVLTAENFAQFTS